MIKNKKKWIVVVAFALIFAAVANFTGCGLFGGGTSNKIEVLTEPKMGATMVYTEYSPIVKAQVKNKSNGTVKVQLKCTIYGSDGSVTLNLTSLIMELAAGESTWLTANTSYSYSYTQYSSKCASFGNVRIIMTNFLMNNKFVVIDLETSGLNKSDYIIEVGAVKIENGKLTEQFSSFVSCSQPLSPETTYLTGITDEQLIGEPSVEEVLKKLQSFSKGCILVAHNMSFDYSFLSKYGEEYGIFFDNPLIDTLTIAKARLNGRVKNFHLGTIAEYLCIETGNLYHSIDYAILAAKIFLELEKM